MKTLKVKKKLCRNVEHSNNQRSCRHNVFTMQDSSWEIVHVCQRYFPLTLRCSSNRVLQELVDNIRENHGVTNYYYYPYE